MSNGVTDQLGAVGYLMTGLFDIYGYDFMSYFRASLKKRINRLYALDLFPSFAEFRFKIH